MRTRFHPRRLVAPLLLSGLLAVPAAHAASIFIDAANLEDRVAFNFGQFEGGFSINGSIPITTGGSVFGEGTQLNFTGQWIDLGAATAFTRTVYWVEPQAPTIISEILQWTITPSGPSGLATISGFFQAEGLGTLPIGVPPADIIVEQADGSHDPFNFSAAFLGGQVITGAELRDLPLPEPGVAMLLAFGILAVLGAGTVRRRVAQAA